MKLYAVLNEIASSDFETKDDFAIVEPSHSSNAHSGGAVVLAESVEQAKELLGKNGHWEGTLTEVPFTKAGVVLWADGDC